MNGKFCSPGCFTVDCLRALQGLFLFDTARKELCMGIRRLVRLTTTVSLLLLATGFSAGAENQGQSGETAKGSPAAAAVTVGETVNLPQGQVAVVNQTIISQSDLDREIVFVKWQFAAMGNPIPDGQLPQIKPRVVDMLIDRELLYQESQKAKISVDDKTVQEQYAQWTSQIAPDGNIQQTLTEMKSSEKAVKDQFKKMLSVEKLIDTRFESKTVISDEELKSFYEGHPDYFEQPSQVRASHILIKADPEADQAQKDAAKKKLQEVQKKLAAGGDFAALAKEYSQCPSSANGGDLGFFQEGMMVKPFEDAAFALEPKQVSNIVETPFGYHLITVTEKKPAATLSFEESKSKITNYLKGKKIDDAVTQYVADLRGKATIKKSAMESTE